MMLYLIRHGESVDNVAGLYAGSRDSLLTNHGVLQAQRLGAHLAARSATIGPVKHIFASDLKRAVKTAQTIAEAQSRVQGVKTLPEVIQLRELREKDFGSEEGKRFGSRGKHDALDGSKGPTWIEPESQELMKIRIERFVDAFFVPTALQAASDPGAGSIVVVAHGIILNVLLRTLLTRFGPDEIAKLARPGDASWRSEWLASWSNTGYLEAELRVATPVALSALTGTSNVEPAGLAADKLHTISEHSSGPVPIDEDAMDYGQPETALASASKSAVPRPISVALDILLILRKVNCVEHLQGLKKTRGGIGSSGHDEKQQTMDTFFSRPAKKLD